VGRNVRSAGAEVDIVATRERTLVFVEVKTRRSDRYGAPEEFVDPRKILRLRRALTVYAARKAYRDWNLRLDIIAVVLDDQGERLRHLKNVAME